MLAEFEIQLKAEVSLISHTKFKVKSQPNKMDFILTKLACKKKKKKKKKKMHSEHADTSMFVTFDLVV